MNLFVALWAKNWTELERCFFSLSMLSLQCSVTTNKKAFQPLSLITIDRHWKVLLHVHWQISSSSFLPGWRPFPVSPCVRFWPPGKHLPTSQSLHCPAGCTEHRKSLYGTSHHWREGEHTNTKWLEIFPMNPSTPSPQWAAAWPGFIKLLKVTFSIWLLTTSFSRKTYHWLEY